MPTIQFPLSISFITSVLFTRSITVLCGYTVLSHITSKLKEWRCFHAFITPTKPTLEYSTEKSPRTYRWLRQTWTEESRGMRDNRASSAYVLIKTSLKTYTSVYAFQISKWHGEIGYRYHTGWQNWDPETISVVSNNGLAWQEVNAKLKKKKKLRQG